jgi:tRNA(Ile)-lysidine synthase
VLGLLSSESGKYVQSPTHRVIRNRSWLIIAPVATEQADTILVEEETEFINADKFRIEFSRQATSNLPTGQAGYKLQTSNSIVQLDSKAISYPLLLRKWKSGDYFYPLGMKKKKKLARFFIDQKLSKTDKENIWVLESDKKILWVIGHRIDDRFKITDQTIDILQVTCLHE